MSASRFSSALGGAVFGLLVAAMGGFFVVALWVGYQRALETREWKEIPCEIIRSEVLAERPTPNSPLAFRAAIQYRFTHRGQARIGDGIKRVDGASSHRRKAVAVVEKYPVGRRLSCWVNPDDPSQSVLQHATKAPLYSIWFPGLFLVAGLGIAGRSALKLIA